MKLKISVYGGGAPEVACALAVSDEADNTATLEQWGMRSFAKALESVPMALAENSGLSPVETLTNLRSEQRTTKNSRLGVDALHTGKIFFQIMPTKSPHLIFIFRRK